MINKQYIILISTLLILHISSYSQFFEEINQNFQTKPKFLIKYNTRNSLISTEGARINSINIGLDYNKTIKTGVGYEWLGSKIERTKFIINNIGITDTVKAKLKLRYLSLFGEYVFYRDKKWEFSLPIILSFGKAEYFYNLYNKNFSINKTFVFGYETQMIGQYNILKWMGIGAGIGYRIILKNKRKIDENFTSPIYILRLKILFNKILS